MATGAVWYPLAGAPMQGTPVPGLYVQPFGWYVLAVATRQGRRTALVQWCSRWVPVPPYLPRAAVWLAPCAWCLVPGCRGNCATVCYAP
jgi:hypothetical protein